MAKGGHWPPFALLAATVFLGVSASAAGDSVFENGVTHELHASAHPDVVIAHAGKGARRTGTALTLGFEVSTADGGTPPPLGRSRIELDRDIRVDPTGIDRCVRSEIEGLESQEALAECAPAQVGQGTATAACQSGGASSDRSLVLAVFNAGERKRPGLLIHAGSSMSGDGLPAVFAARLARGHALTHPGRIAEGSCAISSIELTLEKRTRYRREGPGRWRDYISAQCPDGRWDLDGAFVYEPNQYGVERMDPHETIRCRGTRAMQRGH